MGSPFAQLKLENSIPFFQLEKGVTDIERLSPFTKKEREREAAT